MKSLKNKVLASAMALTLAGGAFIATPKKAEAIGGKELKIKKVLNLPKEGVTTPKETFTFTFTKDSVNGNEGKKNEAPDISPATINYTASDTTDGDDKAGIQVVKSSAENILKNTDFSKEGQYTYTVTESSVTATKGMDYSQAQYKVSIFVGKNAAGDLEVTDIQISTEKDDKGDAGEKKKVPYDPNAKDSEKDKNNFKFENNYDKKDGNDNPSGKDITPEDSKGFALKKTVTGDESKINKNQAFEFSITVTKPEGTHSEDKTFTYKIVNAEGTAGAEKNGTYGTEFTENLKHGERIVFGQILLGSKVAVEETDSKGYTPKVNSKSTLAGQNNVAVDALKSGLVIGDKGDNAVYFENTQQTPTGILIDNLPFIALVLVAGTGIFFFVKNRKEEEALA